MVSHAGKDFLRNCINNAKFHNRIIEENEMWRQWELEQGLTMMVSDDAIRKKNRHTCKYHEKKKRERIEKKKSVLRGKKDLLVTAHQNKPLEKWDHSGFAELYPEENALNSLASSKTNPKHERKSCHEVYTVTSSSESSSDDREVLEDFKEYKRKSRMKHKTKHLESLHDKSKRTHKRHSKSSERSDRKKHKKDKHK